MGFLISQLGFPRDEVLRVACDAESLYRPFEKNERGKTRLIDNPCGPLKRLQRRINRRLLGGIEWPTHVHGGVAGRSPKTNVDVHRGQAYVARIDLQNFFPSVTANQVSAVWRRLGYSPKFSLMLTQLTTRHGYLPHGAPTSTALANLVLLPTDARMLEIVASTGLQLTRFLDDVTVSGPHPGIAIQPLISTLRSAGFRTRRKKLRITGRGGRQESTGLTLNSPLGASRPRIDRDRIRCAVAQLSSMEHDPIAFDRAVRSIRGRIQSVKGTNPGNAARLERLLDARTQFLRSA